MTENTNSPASAGESALSQPSISLEEAANIDLTDPDEDNGQAEHVAQSSDENGEADESQETDGIEAADQEAEGEEAGEEDETSEAPEPDDGITITVMGEKLPLSELKSGYMRQADYSRKTQGIANKNRELDAMAAQVNKSVEAISGFLSEILPQEPDAQTAISDPARYIRDKALHDQAMTKLQSVLANIGDVKTVANTLTAEQHREQVASEFAKLSDAFPTVKTDSGRKAFFDAAASAAREIGYSNEEIREVADHRMFALAHYARIGMKAEAARKTAAKKVESVPPVASPKRQQSQSATVVQRNRDAMKKLSKSGSIDDAMAVDWD